MFKIQKGVMKDKATEDGIEGHLVKRVKGLRGLAVKVVFLPGWPDRMVLLPGGRISWFELKRPKGGKFEPLQPYWIKTLRGLGFSVWVCRTKQDVDEALNVET